MQPLTDLQIVDAAKRFVSENTVEAGLGTACGDGRTTPEQSRGAMRVFGGDAGLIASIIAVVEEKGFGLSASQCVDEYLVAKRQLQGPDAKIQIHTDNNHAAKTVLDSGCGDIAQSAKPENQKFYKASPSGVALMFDRIKTLSPDKMEEMVLEGGHNEIGAILVEGDNDEELGWSVNSIDPVTEESYFVVDVGRVKRFIRQIVPKMRVSGLEAEDVEKSFEKRMKITISLLAKDKPMFSVRFNNQGESSVEFAGRVA